MQAINSKETPLNCLVTIYSTYKTCPRPHSSFYLPSFWQALLQVSFDPKPEVFCDPKHFSTKTSNTLNNVGRTLQQGYVGVGGGGGYGGSGGPFDMTGPQTTTTAGGGGSFTIDPWALGQNYADRQVSVGDTATFSWTQGTHGVFLLIGSSCPSTFQDGQNGMKEIAAATPGPKTVTYTFQESGTFWFACPVDRHCQAGMLFQVTVA
jgi:plastocyanin